MDYGIAWLAIGAVLITLALADAFWTTLTVGGAGWGSSTVAAAIGRVAMKGPPMIAENASVLALFASFLLWFSLLWGGWTLVFCGSEFAVLAGDTKTPADLVDRIYFSGFILTTLGVGDFIPAGGVWQVASVFSAASGFVVLTLFVTYTFSVITALNTRRSLGAAVGHLGESPEAIVGLIKGRGGSALSSRLTALTDQLEKSAMQTDAFPVLEYSHVSNPRRSFARAVVTLGEVALLLENAVEPEASLPRAVWEPLRRAVTLMISEKHSGSSEASETPPPPPDFHAARERGIPLTAQAEENFQQPRIRELRSQWMTWMKWHGREWSVLRMNENHDG